MIVVGWGKANKPLANAGFQKCPHCGNLAPMAVYSRSSQVRLYFVKVAQFGTKYYLVCQTCDCGWEIPEAAKDTLVRDAAHLPSSEQMTDIWNALDDEFARQMERRQQDPAAPVGLQPVSDALKQRFADSHVDYVVAMYVKDITEDITATPP